MRPLPTHLKGQGGYTLVELVIALGIAALLMTALVSVVLTAMRGVGVASSRVEASAQIRNFQYFAYDDFARSTLPAAGPCVPATPCTTQALVLSGVQVSNGAQPVASPLQVSYTWDGSDFVDRSIPSTGYFGHAATGVTAFSWYVDTNSTVVVSMTVTVQAYRETYSESQTFRFFPQMNP